MRRLKEGLKGVRSCDVWHTPWRRPRDVAADAGARRQRQAAMAPLRGQVECGFEQAQFT